MKFITFNWPWSRAAALEDFVIVQSKIIKELQQRLDAHDTKFEEIRVRLSNSEQEPGIKAVNSTPSDWLTERRTLEARYASKGEQDAKQSNVA